MRTSVLGPVGLAAGSVVIALVGSGPVLAAPGQAAGATRPASAASQSAGKQVGRWTVTPAGPSRYRLTWHSPTRIPITDAPVQLRHDGTSVLAAVSANARTVSVVVPSSTPPNPAAYDVLLGSRVLDRRPAATGPGSTSRTPYRAPVTKALTGEDPGEPGTHAIVTTDYKLDPVELPDINQLSEMKGHIVAPVDATDESPLVLFLHGRHEPCYGSDETGHGHKLSGSSQQSRSAKAVMTVWSCPEGEKPVPSYLGYDYVQRLLASQGYVTVSISADAINALDYRAIDGGAAARAALIRDHLRAWKQFVADGTHPADLTNVVLVGHSRGGEGANRASLDLPRDEGYAVTGQVLIGPTDFAFQAAPSTPTVTLLPYCDGDVSDLQGQNFTDDGRDVTTDPQSDLAFHSSVLVMGANHNFFNTEWTPKLSAAPSFDDWGGDPTATCGSRNPSRLTAADQRKVGRAYIAGAVHLFAGGDDSVLPMFDGSPVSVPSAGTAEVRSHAVGGGMVTMRPGLDGSPSAGDTAVVRLCDGVADSRSADACQKRVSSSRTPHWPSEFFTGVPLRQFLDIGWDSSGLVGGLDLDQPWDLSADSRLDLRTVVDPRHGPVQVGVELTDANDDSVVVTPVGGGNLYPLPSGSYSLSKRWGQDLRVSLADATGIDLSQVTRVGLVSRNAAGRVYVADISAAPAAGLSGDPTAPVPVLSIDTVKQTEGNGTDPVTVQVPYHVTGDLEQDATVTLVHSTPFSFDDSVETETLVIPAHTTTGSLPVTYEPNDLDDRGQRFEGLTAYAVSGIETDVYVGGAKIVDDDPTPALTVRADARRVKAGGKASWTASLAAPVNYYAYALARVVKATDGPQLRVGDLTKRFRERYFGKDWPLSTPLYKIHAAFYLEIRPLQTSRTFSLPTRRQGGETRAISLRFRAPKFFDLGHPVLTVKVLPRS
jgi:hypothetical protein